MENKIQVFTKYHWLALGALLGMSLVAGEIWYAVPSRAQSSFQIIPVQNPSFEQVTAGFPTPDRCGQFGWDGQGSFHIPGWQWGANTGAFQPADGNPCLIPTPPDGRNYAYAGYGGTFSQDLGFKPSDLQATSRDGLYSLSFFVVNYFGVYPAYYEAKISIGTPQSNGAPPTNMMELCSIDGWSQQNLTAVTLPCPAPGYLVFDKIFVDGKAIAADPNAHLFFSFTGKGWTVLMDDVSMKFAPQ